MKISLGKVYHKACFADLDKITRYHGAIGTKVPRYVATSMKHNVSYKISSSSVITFHQKKE